MNLRAPVAALVLALAAPAHAERALIIGDSHTVGPFGSALDARLASKGFVTAMDAVCGASANWWIGPHRAALDICYSIHGLGGRNSPQEGAPQAAPPTVAQLAATNPALVVVALGSNVDGSAADTAAALERLIGLLPQTSRCFLVGPPPMPKRLNAINALYKELPQALVRAARNGPNCRLIDSRTLIAPADASPNDHFYGAKATAWGRAAADLIAP